MLLRTYLLIDEQNSHIAKFYKSSWKLDLGTATHNLMIWRTVGHDLKKADSRCRRTLINCAGLNVEVSYHTG